MVGLVVNSTLQANWSESFDGDELDLATWQFLPFPDVTKTFTNTIEVDLNGNKYLSFDETTSATANGSQFGAGFGSDEVFTDVRVGAIVNVTGDASWNHHGLIARAIYVADPDGSLTGIAQGMFAPQVYVMHINWEDGPANLRIDIEKVVNMSNIMRNEEELGLEVAAPGLNHKRSYYAELDVVGSGPVYVTGSLYEYKGGPLVVKTETMVDTNGNDPWENPDVQDEPFIDGQSGIFSQNQNEEPAGYHGTFDDVFSVSDGPAAVNPSPVDGATAVSIDANLSWLEAEFATSRDLWFGKKGAMEKIEQSPEGASFDPGTFEFGQTYEWRIDQIGPSGTVTGRSWTFTAADCMSAEDFDAYTDDTGLMAAWVDNIPDWDYVFLATDAVGNNSIRFELQNQFEPYFTEATRTFDSPQDWTAHGVEALSLSFVGEKENSEHLMYVILEDAAGQSLKVEHPYTYAGQSETWRQWTFVLSQFSDAGVDLSSVKKCTIGFGDGTNSGQEGDDRDIVFIDEINLCPPGSYLTSPYVKWENGPLHSANFFPIAVWLQNPAKASRYRMAGFNTFVGLWGGPTENQLEELKTAGMKVICHQNELALKYIDEPTIIGWMHGDEPDNAQSLGEGKGYGPPIPPQKIIDDYNKIRSVDPTRPVLLNLSQGVAWDGWYGRGVRTNHPEDYLEYVKGCDIASFDIYPAVHSNPQVAGNLWYVARGVERLKNWTDGKKVVWNCIECTRINNKETKATPKQVKCEVWMSLIHGSMGLIYFVHEWQPKFNESALLSDEEMLSAVTEINKQINDLAPVLNSPTIDGDLSASSDNEDVPIAVMAKEYKGAKYLFAVGMRDGKTNASFTVPALKGERSIEVLGENRTIVSKDGVFSDIFEAWDVHLYRVEDKNTN